MQKVLTAQQMREIDYETVIKLRVTERQLMELAGKEACNILLEKLAPQTNSLGEKTFLVVCGKGNNGGDGIVLARHLINAGATVDLIYLCEESQLRQDGAATLKSLKLYLGYTNRLRIFEGDENIPGLIAEKKYDVIIDAILGTGYKKTDHPKGQRRGGGNSAELPYLAPESFSEAAISPVELMNELKPALTPVIRDAIRFINSKRQREQAFVVSLDISSGLDGTTGAVSEAAVEADLTIALAFLKTGFFFGEGKRHSGEVAVADISIPKFLAGEPHCNLVDGQFARSVRPTRSRESSKVDNGKVLIVAGSQSAESSMIGAAILSAAAAVKAGAGYVCVAVPPEAFAVIHAAVPEAVVIAQTENTILEKLIWANAVLIGPGLGRSVEAQALAAKLITHPKFAEKKSVIDADALYAVAELGLLPQLNLPHAVATPHLGEFARLTGAHKSDIDADRLYYAETFTKEFKLGLLLKGPSTLVLSQGKTYISANGTAALATAGTGDVLSGIIVSLAAQGLSIDVAAACGAYLHGLAGQHAAEKVPSPSATDVLRAFT
ncbi:MAG: NAD(P)H-hydrate dehydratase [Rhizobacter sp.]|nr:NAD(P)H-hydrate dehydratase [Chlorobiales bacterium]